MRLENRSRAEGGVPDEVVKKRLATARQEIENYHEYRYVLINDILERAVEELTAIVMAERHKDDPAAAGNLEVQRSRLLADRCRLENSADRLHPVLASFGLSM